MGDKNNGDVTISPATNTALMTQKPTMIIGSGDYDGDVLTMAQILTNLSGLKYSAPGNHDDWVVGVRTEFNANFNSGGYRKITVPCVDFFLYDYYLKMDESGYYTLAEAEAIPSQLVRQVLRVRG
jgi:3',5'-cyclic AMP phosphodiesterase CpdA